jgi:hypothetical protein
MGDNREILLYPTEHMFQCAGFGVRVGEMMARILINTFDPKTGLDQAIKNILKSVAKFHGIGIIDPPLFVGA